MIEPSRPSPPHGPICIFSFANPPVFLECQFFYQMPLLLIPLSPFCFSPFTPFYHFLEFVCSRLFLLDTQPQGLFFSPSPPFLLILPPLPSSTSIVSYFSFLFSFPDSFRFFLWLLAMAGFLPFRAFLLPRASYTTAPPPSFFPLHLWFFYPQLFFGPMRNWIFSPSSFTKMWIHSPPFFASRLALLFFFF